MLDQPSCGEFKRPACLVLCLRHRVGHGLRKHVVLKDSEASAAGWRVLHTATQPTKVVTLSKVAVLVKGLRS